MWKQKKKKVSPFHAMNGRGRLSHPVNEGPPPPPTAQEQAVMLANQRNETVLQGVEQMPPYQPLHPVFREYATLDGRRTAEFPGLQKRDYFMLEIFLVLIRPHVAPGMVIPDETLGLLIQQSVTYSDMLIKAQNQIKHQTFNYVASQILPPDAEASRDTHQETSVQEPAAEPPAEG